MEKKSTVFFSIQIEPIQFLTVFFCSQYLQFSTASFLVKSPYFYFYVLSRIEQSITDVGIVVQKRKKREWMNERKKLHSNGKRNDMARLCSEFW